jgi:hypothetical protein
MVPRIGVGVVEKERAEERCFVEYSMAIFSSASVVERQ